MYIFVATAPDGPRTGFAAITVGRHAPVANYTLQVDACSGAPMQADLLRYSRWSETAVALVARCLALLPEPARLVDVELTGFMAVSVHLGADFRTARPIEIATSWTHGDSLVVTWHDAGQSVETRAPLGVEFDDPWKVLVRTLRLAAWQADVIPPVPAPLSEVPVVVHNGRRSVRLSDIPSHARRHLQRRAAYALVDGYVAEDAWHQFIGRD